MTLATDMTSDTTDRKKRDSLFRSPSLALTLTTLFWSGNFIAGRALHDSIDPVTLNFTRWALALMLFAPFVWRDALAARRVLLREWRLVFALGATGLAAFQTLVYVALQSTTATSALLMLSLAPMAIIAGATITGSERLSRRQLAGVTLSLLGAALVITRGDLSVIGGATLTRGDLWMLLAVAVWAVYSLLLRRRPADLPMAVCLPASMIPALLILAPFLLLGPAPNLAAFGTLEGLLGIGYIAVFSSSLAFLLWFYGVARLGPSRAGQFIQLMPLFGAALAVLLLGESPNGAQFVGAVLVLSGVAIVERYARR